MSIKQGRDARKVKERNLNAASNRMIGHQLSRPRHVQTRALNLGDTGYTEKNKRKQAGKRTQCSPVMETSLT